MKKRHFWNMFVDAIKDPERDINQRTYLALSMVSEVMVFLALIGDIIIKEDFREIIVIALTLIMVPIVGYVGLKREKLDVGIKLTVIALIIFIIPGLFFFGGGLNGGGVLWLIFTFTYAGLVLTGRWRAVTMILVVCEALGFYVLDYYFPEIATDHNRGIFYIDSFLSLVLVGSICFAMTWLQSWLLQGENRRARKAAERAEELSRAQNRFFSSMSHEIRTPINSILGLNELILRDRNASEDIVRDATGIQGSGKMLLALINDILDFSKMEAGSMDIVPVDYRIGDTLSEIVNMVWVKANDKGLRMNVSIDPKVPSVLYGDEVRIKQIILNLLNNAVKYTQEGTIELHIESEYKNEKKVELSISISDTGMGIKKEALPYLFDAFKRVDEEKNRYIEGTGLGLSIVKQLVSLMDGNITVNSVYGEGSTFTVVVMQEVSDRSEIGELSIHNQSIIRRRQYESSFRAPDARILIVDDNEMNLEVESKLLAETNMTIDKALTGKDALALTIENQYDVILMDHLMPEMDGIECLEKIRVQVGGLNRTTPIVVLTANAGSENRELYNRAGFDGYLVKPVSGETLENILMKYISGDKLIISSNRAMSMKEDINASAGYSGKAPVVITSSSMCDLPDYVLKKLNISIVPFMVRTDHGVFKDGVQISADELIRYLENGGNAVSSPPDETDYTEFFASVLKRAHHIIHISITNSMSSDFDVATEAAKSFDNVTVVNSGVLSSATGILVLIAHKLSQMNDSVEEIVEELEVVRERLQCSFIIDTTEYMARKGLVSKWVDSLARSLYLHPCLSIKNNRSRIGGIWMGSQRRAYKRYISRAFPVDVIPDPDVVFITYADVPTSILLWIKEEISKIAFFEHVVFMQASAAISSNCGPGSFGILYFVKTNKSYNIASFVDDESYKSRYEEDIQKNEDYELLEEDQEIEEEVKETAIEQNWFESLEGIDGKIAIQNSGSEEAFKTVLKIFYESIDEKYAELKKYISTGDFSSYTIKVHALKSSAKLIGAMEMAERAQLLENAGKEDNVDYIRAHNDAFMEDYLHYKEVLSPIFEREKEEEASQNEKPVADEYLMESVYEGLLEAAEAMDCDAIDEILKEVEDYSIPENEKVKFEKLCDMAGQFDYDGIVKTLKKS